MNEKDIENSAAERNLREIEDGIRTDLSKGLRYDDYLGLERLLNAQRLFSDPPHHDEMLFIIQHQTSELWMKLIIHELKASIQHIRDDNPGPVLKILSRIKQVQRQLFEQWSLKPLAGCQGQLIKYGEYSELLAFEY